MVFHAARLERLHQLLDENNPGNRMEVAAAIRSIGSDFSGRVDAILSSGNDPDRVRGDLREILYEIED